MSLRETKVKTMPAETRDWYGWNRHVEKLRMGILIIFKMLLGSAREEHQYPNVGTRVVPRTALKRIKRKKRKKKERKGKSRKEKGALFGLTRDKRKRKEKEKLYFLFFSFLFSSPPFLRPFSKVSGTALFVLSLEFRAKVKSFGHARRPLFFMHTYAQAAVARLCQPAPAARPARSWTG